MDLINQILKENKAQCQTCTYTSELTTYKSSSEYKFQHSNHDRGRNGKEENVKEAVHVFQRQGSTPSGHLRLRINT
jgi:hypothetical protein